MPFQVIIIDAPFSRYSVSSENIHQNMKKVVTPALPAVISNCRQWPLLAVHSRLEILPVSSLTQRPAATLMMTISHTPTQMSWCSATLYRQWWNKMLSSIPRLYILLECPEDLYFFETCSVSNLGISIAGNTDYRHKK